MSTPTDPTTYVGTPSVVYSKTISESDVYQFAGITGDLYPVHVDAVYAAAQPVGERVAHGVLLMGLMSTAGARWMLTHGVDGLSYGYDNVRFIRPVLFGDTVTITYTIDRSSEDGRKTYATVEAHNHRGELVGVAQHILWLAS